MSRRGGQLDIEPMRAAYRCVRGWLHWQVRGCTRGVAVAGVVAGTLLLVPTLAGAATPGGKSARPASAAAAAPAASSATATPPRVSPYAIAARRQALAASGTAHVPSVPPSMRRMRKPIGQQVRR
jgi:hypothetical protein